MDPLDERPRFRPARALIGWMEPEEAALTLAGRVEEQAGKPEYQLRASQARTVAGTRLPSIETQGVVEEPPASFKGYIDAFRADPRAGPVYEDGFRIALVDLSKVCAAQ